MLWPIFGRLLLPPASLSAYVDTFTLLERNYTTRSEETALDCLSSEH